MGLVDTTIIIIYLTAIVLVGVWSSRKAARSDDDYFLGGRTLPWWLLGITGMATFLDMGATASLSGWFYLMGIKGYWFMFNGHIALLLSFQMIYGGKWLRRSGCGTNGELISARFGTGRGGDSARMITAAAALLTGVCLMAFFWIGAGKTLSGFLPVFAGNTNLAAGCFFGLIALYAIPGGYYGVVYTNLFQACLILILIMIFAIKGYSAGTPEYFAQHAPAGWFDFAPGGTASPPRDYGSVAAVASLLAKIPLLAPLLVFWVANNLLQGFAFPFDAWSAQPYYAARNEREASLIAAQWISLASLRYLLVPAVAVLALPLVAHIADPEQTLPTVMKATLAPGLFGVLFAGLLAGGMSAVNSIANACAAYFVRDLYHPFMRPQATSRQLTRASYWTVFLILALGGGLGMTMRNIDAVWGWIMMSVFVGALPPNIAKWIWWRANGWSLAAGYAAGFAAVIAQSFMPSFGGFQEPVGFLLVIVSSTLATVTAALLTSPADMPVLVAFYERIRPFGWWGPVRARASTAVVDKARREGRRDLLLLPVVLVWHFSLFCIWGCLILKQFHLVAVFAVAIALTSIVLFRYWYRNLPAKETGDAST